MPNDPTCDGQTHPMAIAHDGAVGRLQIVPAHLVAVFLSCLFGLTLVYGEVLRHPVFGPHFPEFWHRSEVRNPRIVDKISRYFYVWGDWYRPTQDDMPWHVVSAFVAWDDLLGWHMVSLIGWALLGTCVYTLMNALYSRDHLAGAFAVLFFIAHPVINTPVMDVVGFEWMCMLFIVLSVLLYHRHHTTAPSARSWNGSLLCFIVALTCKEPAILLPFALLLHDVLYAPHPDTLSLIAKARRSARKLRPFWIVLCLYMSIRFYGLFLHVAHAGADTNYPTYPAREKILRNTINAALWISRLFRPDPYSTAYLGSGTTTFGLAALCSLAFLSRLRRSDGNVERGTTFLLGFLVLFASMPVYSGFAPSHFALSAMAYAMLVGASLSAMMRRLPGGQRTTAAAAALLAALIVLQGAKDFRAFRYRDELRLDANAISESVQARLPIDASLIRADSFILIDDPFDLGTYVYGSGLLFRYLYGKASLREEILQAGKDETLLAWIESESRFGLRWDRGSSRFTDVTEELAERVRHRLTARYPGLCLRIPALDR